MSEKSGIKLSDAFNRSLKELAINEFPCGNGKWRSGKTWRCDAPDLLNPLKEQNADLESIQSLLEMMENEPFQTKSDWSEDCSRLRKIAVKHPEKITKDNIFLYFTKLRLVGRNITEVDDILLKFTNLKDITLTANCIENIDLKNIPKTLEVLELYGNRISSIEQFCFSLPALIHFGIGSNSLTTINKTLHPRCWNQLLSIDLSFNGLAALKETLDALKHLPKLSNLLLIGNPLFLASSYRGIVVDTLTQLSVLDDDRITADEKHRYKGISRLKGISFDEAIFEISLNSLKGIKSPLDLENEASGEDSPKTDYRYQVSYPFLLNCIAKKVPKIPYEVAASEKGPELNPEADDRLSVCETDDEVVYDDARIEGEGNYLVRRKVKERSWCEDEIKISYERKLITSDLSNLKRFLLEGLCLDLIENKVIVSLDCPEDSNSLIGDGEIEKGTKVSKSKAAQKDKLKQPVISKMNTSKSKRKTKEMMPLYELSRESKTIGTLKVPLDGFVQGIKFFEKECIIAMEINDNESEIHQEEPKESKIANMKKIGSIDGRKKGKDLKKPPPSPPGQRTKSAMSNKPSKSEKQEKNAKIKENKSLGEIAENDTEPPPEITIDVTITLHSWKNEEEARNWIDDNS